MPYRSFYTDLAGSTIPAAAINLRLNKFLKAFTRVLYLMGGVVLLSITLKLLHLPGGFVLFIFSMTAISFLFLLQTGISFVYVFSNAALAFLGAISSLTVGLSCITLVFLFQQWWGTSIMLFLTLPLLVLSLIFLVAFFISGRHRHMFHRKFLYFNILAPFLYLLVLCSAYYLYQGRREPEDTGRREDVQMAVVGNQIKLVLHQIKNSGQ